MLKRATIILVFSFFAAVLFFAFASADANTDKVEAQKTEHVQKTARTFLVGYSYKHTWGRQVQGTIRVTTVYYATDGQEFLMAVIRDLKEAGIIPADEYFDNAKKSSLTLLSIDPIPADFVATTEDPRWNPKQEPDNGPDDVEDVTNEPKPKD